MRLRSLAVLVVILAFTSTANAQKVDWSAYVDSNPSRPVKSESVVLAPEKPAKQTRAKKAKAKKVAKAKKGKAKVKARKKKAKKSRRR